MTAWNSSVRDGQGNARRSVVSNNCTLIWIRPGKQRIEKEFRTAFPIRRESIIWRFFLETAKPFFTKGWRFKADKLVRKLTNSEVFKYEKIGESHINETHIQQNSSIEEKKQWNTNIFNVTNAVYILLYRETN